ncbi:major facilitator superfamily domain-containing protein [Echria macrotheca]|uniref:Major facilitator superfamily domain-containing protein n=1 Tax=Echria macrotheca TaxID=438768 RepID=A0AAJ0F7T5_9PEZI|nr:major facilitator superfamily domain-containing protein [Echria macrotheca]
MSTKQHEEISENIPQDHDGVEIAPGIHHPFFDTEKGTPPPAQSGTPIDEQFEDTRHVITWDGPSDPQNPINWPRPRKWAISIFVSLGGFVTLMSGSMIAPALPALCADLSMTSTEAESSLSIFILAFAFGPLLLAPFTEVYGRKPVWVTCGFVYAGWSVVCGFARNKATLIAVRFLAGLGGSVDFVVALPIMSDIWPPEQRGQSFALVNCIPLLGPALGPLLGGLIADNIGWRWIFWIASIFCAALMLTALLFLPETSATQILATKAKKLRAAAAAAADTGGRGGEYQTSLPSDDIHRPRPPLAAQLRRSIARPVRILATQPAMQLVSVLMAYNFGILYYLLATFASLHADVYREPAGETGLHYLAIVTGYLVANFAGAGLMDWLWRRLKRRSASNATAPEFRVPLMVPAGLLTPAGLLWYGWSAEAGRSRILTDVGAGITGCGILLHTGAMQAYVLDAFPDFTASAMGASQVLRMIFGFVFPIFAPAMQARLGWGWSNTVIALIAVVFGVMGPLVLWNFGARLRAAGKPVR